MLQDVGTWQRCFEHGGAVAKASLPAELSALWGFMPPELMPHYRALRCGDRIEVAIFDRAADRVIRGAGVVVATSAMGRATLRYRRIDGDKFSESDKMDLPLPYDSKYFLLDVWMCDLMDTWVRSQTNEPDMRKTASASRLGRQSRQSREVATPSAAAAAGPLETSGGRDSARAERHDIRLTSPETEHRTASDEDEHAANMEASTAAVVPNARPRRSAAVQQLDELTSQSFAADAAEAIVEVDATYRGHRAVGWSIGREVDAAIAGLVGGGEDGQPYFDVAGPTHVHLVGHAPSAMMGGNSSPTNPARWPPTITSPEPELILHEVDNDRDLYVEDY
jgi:hypothetical protein